MLLRASGNCARRALLGAGAPATGALGALTCWSAGQEPNLQITTTTTTTTTKEQQRWEQLWRPMFSFGQQRSRSVHGGAGGSDLPKKEEGPKHWTSRLPPSVSPYAKLMRLDKPIGSWLLAWPSFWSIALAANPGSLPDLHMIALFGSGAVLLRGAGCTINDLWDRDLDSKVERTRQRPLAAKEVSPAAAVAFLGAHLSLGLGILLQLNNFSQLLGAASLPLVVAYPLMKRITNWPQAVLGLTINWGALLGWSAVHGSLDPTVTLPLYLSGVAWTLVYDTIYAHQDKVDDVKVGIKSTALHFGQSNKQWLSVFALLHGLSLATVGYFGDLGSIFYATSALGTSSLLWKIHTINLDNPKECMDAFVQNKWYGALVFSGIAMDKVASPLLS
ncbi:4-hydroxybenzoate octaprenyltransferase [Chloropicon primus]|nr:4-hydroxybenzoate octaprenyltransferase [Chloropicon primus]